jgi:hypothetical protein
MATLCRGKWNAADVYWRGQTRGAALIEAGVTFREHAARVCAEIDIARETILPAGDLRGRLRIAAPLLFGPTHLALVLAELARRQAQGLNDLIATGGKQPCATATRARVPMERLHLA